MAPEHKLDYQLSDQIGFILRIVNQRHTGIFAELMPDELTPTRFAALVKLLEFGTISQNQLGRHTAMDVATIKGVVDRLRNLGLVQSRLDPLDGRRQLIELTEKGTELALRSIPIAKMVTKKTTEPLQKSENKLLMQLLRKMS